MCVWAGVFQLVRLSVVEGCDQQATGRSSAPPFQEREKAIGGDMYGLLRADGSVEIQAVAYSCPWRGAGGCIASSSVLVAGEG